jgi:hypothetical protein
MGPSRAAEKGVALKGHGSSRIVTGKEIEVLKGHDFSRAVSTAR